MPGRLVFVFQLNSGDVDVVSDLEAARQSIEPEDVSVTEVVDARREVFRPIAQGQGTALVARGLPDRDALEQRLRLYVDERGISLTAAADFVAAVADALAAVQWSRRWPKRPAWLDRRLHGRGPTSSTTG